jgi:predicted O-methyltransferase YrrM
MSETVKKPKTSTEKKPSVRTSYNKCTLDYGEVLKAYVFAIQPSQIVEIGILDGFSLQNMADTAPPHCTLVAYDIFENFNGNAANFEQMSEKFQDDKRVSICRGDFYKLHSSLEDGSIDLLHIDIANNGEVYEFCFENYFEKLRSGGLLILEGGIEERDQVEWMLKYKKKSIVPVISRIEKHKMCYVHQAFPGMTVLKKQ